MGKLTDSISYKGREIVAKAGYDARVHVHKDWPWEIRGHSDQQRYQQISDGVLDGLFDLPLEDKLLLLRLIFISIFESGD